MEILKSCVSPPFLSELINLSLYNVGLQIKDIRLNELFYKQTTSFIRVVGKIYMVDYIFL